MANQLTIPDVLAWEARNAFPLTDEERAVVVESSACDPGEGPEWLPWYKAALSLMARMNGYLAGVALDRNGITSAQRAELNRMWVTHCMFCGVGADVLDAAALAERTRIAVGTGADLYGDGGMAAPVAVPADPFTSIPAVLLTDWTNDAEDVVDEDERDEQFGNGVTVSAGGSAPILTVFGADQFPCLDEDDPDEVDKFLADHYAIIAGVTAVPRMVRVLADIEAWATANGWGTFPPSGRELVTGILRDLRPRPESPVMAAGLPAEMVGEMVGEMSGANYANAVNAVRPEPLPFVETVTVTPWPRDGRAP